MDRLEQRLKDYYKYHEEYRPEAISGAFLERLKALEASPEAARRPRRRYILPVAAALALAVALGGWFAWLHAATPEPAQTPVAIQSGPSNAVAEIPEEPSKPDTKPQAGAKEPKPEEASVSEESVTLTKPAASSKSGDATPAEPEGGAASTSNFRPHALPGGNVTAKPDATLPVLPINETPATPNSETPKPNDETSTEPAVEPSADPDNEQSEKADDSTPAEPDDPTPTEHDDPNPQVPEDPDPPEITPPPDDPPYVLLSGIGAAYRMEDGRETLTLTLLSTGECAEIDVTGWMEKAKAEAQAAHPASELDPHQGEKPVPAASAFKFTDVCFAFGQNIVYHLKLEEDGTVRAEAMELEQYIQRIEEGVQP